jgi:hypothetical protein
MFVSTAKIRIKSFKIILISINQNYIMAFMVNYFYNFSEVGEKLVKSESQVVFLVNGLNVELFGSSR